MLLCRIPQTASVWPANRNGLVPSGCGSAVPECRSVRHLTILGLVGASTGLADRWGRKYRASAAASLDSIRSRTGLYFWSMRAARARPSSTLVLAGDMISSLYPPSSDLASRWSAGNRRRGEGQWRPFLLASHMEPVVLAELEAGSVQQLSDLTQRGTRTSRGSCGSTPRCKK